MGCEKMKEYKPELGQAVFGQPHKKYECPEYIIALLEYLEYEMESEGAFKDGYSPFRNTGNKWKNEVFEAESYSWNEDVTQPWNFKYGDLEISWYKHIGRGTSINFIPAPSMMVDVFNECLKSIRQEEI